MKNQLLKNCSWFNLKNQNSYQLKKFIIATMEGTTEAPNEESCDNIQILGVVDAYSIAEAGKKVIEENPFILDLDFNPEEFIFYQVTPDNFYHIVFITKSNNREIYSYNTVNPKIPSNKEIIKIEDELFKVKKIIYTYPLEVTDKMIVRVEIIVK